MPKYGVEIVQNTELTYIVLWCSGNTSAFGAGISSSSLGGTTKINKKYLVVSEIIHIFVFKDLLT